MTTEVVYIVMQYDAEPWESYGDGIHAIFSTKKSAQKYLEDFGLGPHWTDKELNIGYILSETIEEWQVNDI